MKRLYVLAMIVMAGPAGAEDCRMIASPQSRLQCWDRKSEETAAGKELVVMTLFEVFVEGQTTCNFKLDGDRYKSALASSDMKAADVFTLARSPNLQRAIDAIQDAYREDPGKSCARLWERDRKSTPNMRYFLSR